MNAWVVIPVIAVVALLYVVIPVGLAMRRHFSTYKLVRCPVLGVGAGVLIRRGGLAAALGWPALRHVSDCTYWPRHRACAQGCRLAPDEEFRDYRHPLA
jgi:hypothetical protein